MIQSVFSLFPLIFGAILGFASAVSAQSTLDEAANAARDSWLKHDMQALLISPDPLELRVPGSRPARPLGPGQAAALLTDFVRYSEEVSLEFRSINQAADDQGFVEGIRKYRVSGTSEESSQRVFLGFKKVGDQWRLTALRISG